MLPFGPFPRLLLFLLLAAAGVWLFFGNSTKALGVDVGWAGSFLIAVGAWGSVRMLQVLPRSEGEMAISAGEWQAWVGLLFSATAVIATLLYIPVFSASMPITANPEASSAGRHIGALFVAWAVLAYVLRARWDGLTLADERDRLIEQRASEWGGIAIVLMVIGVALLLGFSPTERLQQFSYPVIATWLVAALLIGVAVDNAVAALLYWRDRRETSE